MTKYIEYVKALYLKRWAEAKIEALKIIAPEEAPKIVQELTLSLGWRERVAAANVISAFELYPLAPALIQTFEANPENYTCSSFSLLVNELPNKEQAELRNYMLSCCPKGNYGDHLRTTIFSCEKSAL